MTLDESWLAGSVEIQARMPRSDLFNAVKGVYVDPDREWQPTDFPIITNTTYEAQDGGFSIIRDLELPYTLHSEAAQRIAKIALEKSRQGIIATLPCNMKALQVAIYDTISVTLTQPGWSSKVFRVIQWELNDQGGVTLTVQEESSASYDWNNGEATTYDPAPDTNLPDPTVIESPGNPVVTEGQYTSTTGSGVKVKVTLTWAVSENAFIDRYRIEYKLSSDSTWTFFDEVDDNTTTGVIFDFVPGVYDFAVTAISIRNVSSDRAISSKEIIGLSGAPAAITDFTLNAIHNSAHLKWTQASDLDVQIGGGIELRWASAISGATWSEAMPLGPVLSGIATNAVVPLLTGTYFIKAVDSSGNKSETATSIVSTIANVVNLNTVATSTQHPTFSGSKTNMAVDGGDLVLNDSILFDDAAGNFDEMNGNFDDAGGVSYETSGSYEFDSAIDLGDVLHLPGAL